MARVWKKGSIGERLMTALRMKEHSQERERQIMARVSDVATEG